MEAASRAEKRKRFAPPVLREKPRTVPKARELSMNVLSVQQIEAPSDVVDLLGSRDLVIGVDVETHDWNSNGGSKGHFGNYGCYTRCTWDLGGRGGGYVKHVMSM